MLLGSFSQTDQMVLPQHNHAYGSTHDKPGTGPFPVRAPRPSPIPPRPFDVSLHASGLSGFQRLPKPFSGPSGLCQTFSKLPSRPSFQGFLPGFPKLQGLPNFPRPLKSHSRHPSQLLAIARQLNIKIKRCWQRWT